MLRYEQRNAILELHKKGHSKRFIARSLEVSRNTIKKVLTEYTAQPSLYQRPEQLEVHQQLVQQLYEACKGNCIRVHEELRANGVEVSYSAVTSYCRRNGISVKPKKPSGRYHFEPGAEMQHDTSPHAVVIAGKKCEVQCASLVLCFPLMRYARVYQSWNRFICKNFLTEALKYFGGSAHICEVDNSSVVILKGTGKKAVVVPEMNAFGKRYGFEFEAHALGDANRSAKVEKTFDYVERNFYAGRTFSSLTDLNSQLIKWCKADHKKFKHKMQARPIDLYQTEKQYLNPLPIHIPEVYEREIRTVDLESYINVDTNRYSVPAKLIGREVEVYKYIDKIRVFYKLQLITEHKRCWERYKHLTKAEHRFKRERNQPRTKRILPGEQQLRTTSDALDALITAIKNENSRTAAARIRKLEKMHNDYPQEYLIKAINHALQFKLTDLQRIEKILLDELRQNFFKIHINKEP